MTQEQQYIHIISYIYKIYISLTLVQLLSLPSHSCCSWQSRSSSMTTSAVGGSDNSTGHDQRWRLIYKHFALPTGYAWILCFSSTILEFLLHDGVCWGLCCRWVLALDSCEVLFLRMNMDGHEHHSCKWNSLEVSVATALPMWAQRRRCANPCKW